MCQGRCPCGFTGPDGRVRAHSLSCPEFARACQDGLASVSSTVQLEYDRWAAGGRRQERAEGHAASVAETDARRAAMAERFRGRDILADD